MCVWQSQAPAGTSKLTAVAGCEGLAMAKRGASAAAVAANSTWRRFVMVLLELVAAHAAVDRNHGAGDVARARRSEKTGEVRDILGLAVFAQDRKSTRLNSSHVSISYAVFCLKKKTKTKTI